MYREFDLELDDGTILTWHQEAVNVGELDYLPGMSTLRRHGTFLTPDTETARDLFVNGIARTLRMRTDGYSVCEIDQELTREQALELAEHHASPDLWKTWFTTALLGGS